METASVESLCLFKKRLWSEENLIIFKTLTRSSMMNIFRGQRAFYIERFVTLYKQRQWLYPKTVAISGERRNQT